MSDRPGVPESASLSFRVRMPARMLGSPSFNWITCSTRRCPMMGCCTPEMVTVFAWFDISMISFSVISRSWWTVGVMSMVTPISR